MKNLLLFTLILLLMGCTRQPEFNYPETAKGDVVDNYHGTEVPDPYRWLEDDMSDETAAWVKAQNAVTFSFLETIPFREAVKARMTEIWNYPKMGTPSKEGGNYLYSYNTGLQNQSILYLKRELEGEGEVFLDPNELSEDGTVALTGYNVSNNHKYAAYGISEGGSNGGLLIGAVINQRPDLFAVAIPMVGVMDMLRFHKFTIGRYWTVDYGSSDDPEQFEYLLGYSTLHNISENLEYPAVLVTTGDHDDRVVPAHSFKYIATLQEKYGGKNPVMIRINTDAGHGAGKPTDMAIREYSDIGSFIWYNMEVTPSFD